MARIELEDILRVLEDDREAARNEIHLDPDVLENARLPLERMIELSQTSSRTGPPRQRHRGTEGWLLPLDYLIPCPTLSSGSFAKLAAHSAKGHTLPHKALLNQSGSHRSCSCPGHPPKA